MTIRPHDPGTFFVTSESESKESEIEYLVDWTERTCTCPVFMDFTKEPHTNGTWCKHLSAVCEYVNPPKRQPFSMAGILGMKVQGQCYKYIPSGYSATCIACGRSKDNHPKAPSLNVKTKIIDGKEYDRPF